MGWRHGMKALREGVVEHRDDLVQVVLSEPGLGDGLGVALGGHGPDDPRQLHQFLAHRRADAWGFDPLGLAQGELQQPHMPVDAVVADEGANEDLGGDQLLQRCALAYISDDMPTDAVVRAFPSWKESPTGEWDHSWFAASLDHSMWFHRPVRTDDWHLYDFTCHSYVAGRGLALGHIFTAEGVHVATVAQEVLVRPRVERGA